MTSAIPREHRPAGAPRGLRPRLREAPHLAWAAAQATTSSRIAAALTWPTQLAAFTPMILTGSLYRIRRPAGTALVVLSPLTRLTVHARAALGVALTALAVGGVGAVRAGWLDATTLTVAAALTGPGLARMALASVRHGADPYWYPTLRRAAADTARAHGEAPLVLSSAAAWPQHAGNLTALMTRLAPHLEDRHVLACAATTDLITLYTRWGLTPAAPGSRALARPPTPHRQPPSGGTPPHRDDDADHTPPGSGPPDLDVIRTAAPPPPARAAGGTDPSSTPPAWGQARSTSTRASASWLLGRAALHAQASAASGPTRPVPTVQPSPRPHGPTPGNL